MWLPVGTLASRARLGVQRSGVRVLSGQAGGAPDRPYKVLLLGADAFSCATLQALHDAREGLIDELVVVTPPEKRSGRGLRTVHTPPLKSLADKLGYDTMPVPATGLKGWQVPPSFASATPSPSSILLTASFGYMIPASLLDKFLPLNTLNVHPSLLPRYRGASPIQYTVINGDREMGVSVQELSKGKFDRGRLLGQKSFPTPPRPTFASLEPVLAAEGGSLLVDVLRNFAEAQANAAEQDPALATLAPKLHKDIARVDWTSKTGPELLRLQAGVAHQFPLWSKLLPLDPAHAAAAVQLELAPPPPGTASPAAGAGSTLGTLIFDKPSKTLLVSCHGGGGLLEVVKVKPAGSKWAAGREWWNGAGGKTGEVRRLI